ncbi:hypothetical protein ER308_06525 [Egibacter rhizosphaerae]|uniref:Tetratricopeptide repeat protein n=1 Tax=Egibacter rhizosphaerae TaxID=1670831 RepID=A0A411YDG9_9ACTN|nr:tetratricopeptide repeat protein [Egibacter rhizosphaerae]QBI19228.1 hypothetical protein ER308_06525 [Egibacter rhizosphaerae]
MESTTESAAAPADPTRPFGAAAVERGLLALLVVSPLACSTTAVDPFRLPELTVVLLVTAGLVGTRLTLAVAERRVPLPRPTDRPARVAVVAAGVFGLFATIAGAVTADAPWRAMLGEYGHANGLLLLVAVVVVFLVALDRLDEAAGGRLVVIAVGVALVVGVHALAQLLHIDPIDWRMERTDLAGTMGTRADAGAIVGLGVPLALGLGLAAREQRRRVGAAAVAIGLLALAAVIGSPAGASAALAGAAIVAVVWFVVRGWRRAAAVLGAVTVGALALVVSGVGGVGPLQALADRAGGAARWGWETALAMVADAPLSGVGLGAFNGHAGTARGPEVAAGSQVPASGVEPASLPLHLAAEGGLPLLAAFVALQVVVGVVLVRGLRATAGRLRWRLAGVGAAWAGWLVHGLVTSPGPAVWVWGVVLAALVIVVRRGRSTLVEPAAAPKSVAGIAGVLACAIGVAALVPLVADRVAGQGQALAVDGQPADAQLELERATRVNPLEARYWLERGELARAVGEGDLALRSYQEASRREPRDSVVPERAARVATQMEDTELAGAQWSLAVALDPWHPPLLDEAAAYWSEQGEPARGEALVERALRVEDEADRWALLGQVRLAAGDVAGAETAFAEAIERDPSATERLDLDALP